MIQECCAPQKDMGMVHAELMEWREHHGELEEAAKRRKEAKDKARRYIDGKVQVLMSGPLLIAGFRRAAATVLACACNAACDCSAPLAARAITSVFLCRRVEQFNREELHKLSKMARDSLTRLQAVWGSKDKAVMVLETPHVNHPAVFSANEDDNMKRIRMDPHNYIVVLVNDAFASITGKTSRVIGHSYTWLIGQATDKLKLKLLEMSLSRSTEAKVENIVLYLREGKTETPMRCTATYYPLYDYHFNPVYHCLCITILGAPVHDVVQYLVSKQTFAGACKKTENMVNIVRARDPDIQAHRIGEMLYLNQVMEAEAAERRRHESPTMPATLRKNINVKDKESLVIAGDDGEKGKIRTLTHNPENVMDDKGGSHSRDPHFRKLFARVGLLETKRYQRAVEAGFFIRNDPAELCDLARTTQQVREVHGMSHPTQLELDEKLKRSRLATMQNKK